MYPYTFPFWSLPREEGILFFKDYVFAIKVFTVYSSLALCLGMLTCSVNWQDTELFHYSACTSQVDKPFINLFSYFNIACSKEKQIYRFPFVESNRLIHLLCICQMFLRAVRYKYKSPNHILGKNKSQLQKYRKENIKQYNT